MRAGLYEQKGFPGLWGAELEALKVRVLVPRLVRLAYRAYPRVMTWARHSERHFVQLIPLHP